MAYGAGERLNWHFDRAEFTITILLQAPLSGGEFRYRSGLRSDSDPNYEGVARLLTGHDERVQTLPLAPGTLNVFKGKNTAHRVTPVEGDRARIIAVFSYYERPDVAFSDRERLGFYGRTGPVGAEAVDTRDDRSSLLQPALPRLRASGEPHGAHGLARTASSCGRTLHRWARFPSARSSWWISREQQGVHRRLRHAQDMPAGSPVLSLRASRSTFRLFAPYSDATSRAATATHVNYEELHQHLGGTICSTNNSQSESLGI